jgi:hypothetical protein
VTLEIRLESLKGVSLSTFGNADHAPGERVMKNREITQSATDVFLIDTQGGDFTARGRLTGRLYVDIDSPPDPILGDPKHLGDGRNRELLSQRQNQGIH